MWLAGEALPYYYWGSLVWTLPLSLSGMAIEVGYNLVVALVAGLAAASLWMVGRRLAGGSHWAGLTAAFFALFAGTPDGMRQLLAGITPGAIDLWASSRQISDTITEFPLFSLWLGDLHPHVLSIPLASASLLVALHVGRRGAVPTSLAVLGLLVGATWAANPWAMPPTVVAVGLCLICGDGRWRWPVRRGVRKPLGEREWRWLAAAAVPVVAWLAMAPFHLHFHPPFGGIRPVFAWTLPHQLLLYGGCLLLPTLGLAVSELRRIIGNDELRGRTIVLSWAALTVLLAVVSGRVTLVLLASALVVLVLAGVSRGEDPGRPAIALAALGVFLFLVPEVVYVHDSYGEKLHRMNTVFKAYIQGWVLLAAVLPFMLRRWLTEPIARRMLTVILVGLTLPHLFGAIWNGLNAEQPSLDGFRWMDEGDRAVVTFLRTRPEGESLIEAAGDPYSEYARMSAASGVPALLGWANHELVWRGREIAPETGRRSEVVRRIYECRDPEEVRELVTDADVDLVLVGSLERKDFPVEGLDAVRAAGRVIFEHGNSAVIDFAGSRPGAITGEQQ